MHRIAFASFVSALALASSAAVADFVNPVWDRPVDDAGASTELTTYQAWDVFTGTTAQTPDAADVNPNGSASLSELIGGAFVTSGGNIYSPGAPVQFLVTVPGYATVAEPGTNFQVQVRTIGTELDTSSMTVDGLPASTLPGYSYEELARTPLGDFGAQVDHRFQFYVPSTQAGFALGFGSEESSLSLDQVAIDSYANVNVVPEPTSLVGLAGSGLLLLRRRR